MENMVSFTLLTQVKENREKFQLSRHHQTHILKTCMMILAIQAGLCCALFISIYKDYFTLV